MEPKLEAIIRAFSHERPRSLRAYSSQIVSVLQKLGGDDKDFLTVQFEGERMKPVRVELSQSGADDVIDKVAESIIEFNRYDIRKFGKVKDPGFDYVPDHPMGMLAAVETQQGRVYFGIRMGSSMLTLPHSWVCRDGEIIKLKGIDWSKEVFRTLMDVLNYGYGSAGSFYREDIRKQNFNGWLLNYSYFSKSGPYIVPKGIPDVAYEETEKGVYLSIGNKLCTSTDDPEYQEQKQIRLEATRRIKQANGLN